MGAEGKEEREREREREINVALQPLATIVSDNITIIIMLNKNY